MVKPNNMNEYIATGVLEGLLFISGAPLCIDDLCETLSLSRADIFKCIDRLKKEYSAPIRGIDIHIAGNRISLKTKPEIFPYIEKHFKPKVKSQLSKAALETLAIIIMKQPVTRTEIETIRGVNSEKALSTLMSKELIYEKGRLDSIGRPILYAITENCLDYFGIEDIDDFKKKLEMCIK